MCVHAASAFPHVPYLAFFFKSAIRQPWLSSRSAVNHVVMTSCNTDSMMELLSRSHGLHIEPLWACRTLSAVLGALMMGGVSQHVLPLCWSLLAVCVGAGAGVGLGLAERGTGVVTELRRTITAWTWMILATSPLTRRRMNSIPSVGPSHHLNAPCAIGQMEHCQTWTTCHPSWNGAGNGQRYASIP